MPSGKVEGDIVASQSLSVVSPASIKGNITTPSLSVTEGAIIDGKRVCAQTGYTPQPAKFIDHIRLPIIRNMNATFPITRCAAKPE